MEIVCICALAICVVFGIKNHNSFINRNKIIDAMYYCCVDNRLGAKEYLAMNSRMESYESTFLRLWDWGCTRIVDEETFELIKPYIKKGKKNNE